MTKSSTVRIRFDASYPRDYIDGEGAAQTRWNAIGTGFLGSAGISVLLHAVPTALTEGQTRFALFPAASDGEPSPMPPGLPERFVVSSYRTYETGTGERTAKTRLGVAFTKRDSITVLLDAIPSARWDGCVRLFLRDAAADVGKPAEGGDDGDNKEDPSRPAEEAAG